MMIKEKMRPLWAEINLDHLAYNVSNIKKLVGKSRLVAIVKADAYGHGASCVAKTMVEAGAEAFGVAVITEALEMRESGVKETIMVLSYTPPAYFSDAIRNDIILNCLSYEDVEKLDQVAGELNMTAKILISLDTGIGRVGFQPDEEGIAEIIRMKKLKNIEMNSIYTHFASADFEDKKTTLIQLEKYKYAIGKLKEAGVVFEHEHVANSAAIVDMKETYLESVRPGIILYGYHPSEEVRKENLSLKPVMSIRGRIIQLKTVPKGTGISYGHRYVTYREETKIATIPIGYADGYFRALSGKAKVIVHGILCPQVGSVCMDHIMVDVTEVPDVKVLDIVTLMGEENGVSFTADDIAKITGTIPYEVVCAVSKRVPRIYMKNNEEIERREYV